MTENEGKRVLYEWAAEKEKPDDAMEKLGISPGEQQVSRAYIIIQMIQ